MQEVHYFHTGKPCIINVALFINIQIFSTNLNKILLSDDLILIGRAILSGAKKVENSYPITCQERSVYWWLIVFYFYTFPSH